MIRWYVDKDGNKKLQQQEHGYEEIDGKMCEGMYWNDVPVEYDIISDTPIEESPFISDALKHAEEASKSFNKDLVNHLDKLETKIEAELVVEAGLYDPKLGDFDRKEIYRGPVDVPPRRQFDVSKAYVSAEELH